MNCSVYTNYKLKNDSLINFLGEIYSNLSVHDPWAIESQIISDFQEIMPSLMPVTKGYSSGDKYRKIFLGNWEDIVE